MANKLTTEQEDWTLTYMDIVSGISVWPQIESGMKEAGCDDPDAMVEEIMDALRG